MRVYLNDGVMYGAVMIVLLCKMLLKIVYNWKNIFVYNVDYY